MKTPFSITSLALLILAARFWAGKIEAQTIAFLNPTALPANGLQTEGDEFGQPFALGLEFTVNSPIVISQLGAYDATIGGSGAGFGSTVLVAIFDESSQTVVSPVATFSGTNGTVVAGYRFQAVTQFVLNPGNYQVVACGYGVATAPDWNSVVAGISPSPVAFNGSNGLLTLGSSWYADDATGGLEMPYVNGGSGALFAAGSFQYSALQAMSTPFSFVLDEPCKTSAGVFAPDGTLIRTLWSKVRYPAGTNQAVWDGLDDNHNIATTGIYQITLLQHNTEYVWDGAIGNTSAEKSGPTVHRGYWPMRDMAISGTNAFYVSGYDEGGYDFRNFLTTDPQRVKMSWYWVVQSNAVVSVSGDVYDLNWLWTAADSHRVYFACSGTPNPANVSVPYVYPGCIVSCNVGDNSPAYFSNGIPIVNNGGNSPLPNGIYVGTQTGLSGLSVQQNGNLLAASVTPDNAVYLMDKTTGASLGSFSVDAPGRLNFSPDGTLWVISGDNLIGFTNLLADATALVTITNFAEPLDVAVSPTNANLILVADGGGSQQVKAYDRSGNPLWTYGQPGGYQANGVAVATNKFWFFDGENDGTFICFAPDGTFWVGDGANHRALHFSVPGNYLEQIMYQPHSYVTCVDPNNISRVFNQFMEFNVDYSQPLAQAWTVVNNWKANVDSCHISFNEGIRDVTTFTNGHTYALIDHNCIGNTLPEICELATNELRFSGIYPMVTNQGRWICLGPDGSARATAFGLSLWYEATLSGFDSNNFPTWNPETLIASASQAATDPVPRCCSFGIVRATISTNNILISFDQTLNDGWHLGGIRLGDDKWLWKASPAVALMDGTGNYEISNGVNYPGDTLEAVDRNIAFGYHGEFFRGEGQAGQTMHFYDDGLFVGQFGEASPGHAIYEDALPGFAGNGVAPTFMKTTNGDYYLWINDESDHGPQRWHFVNARNIREQSGSGYSGTTLALTNQPSTFPTAVTAKNGNHSAELCWQPVPGAVSYNIKCSFINGRPYSTLMGSTTNLHGFINGLTNGVTYYFAVTAALAGGEGMPSEQVAVNPFDTTQAVSCSGSEAEGGLLTPLLDVSSSASNSGLLGYIGAEHLTGVLNPRELDDYGFGNLRNETLGTKGYAIYSWGGVGTNLTNVLSPFTVTLGSGWNIITNLVRQFKVDGVTGASNGLIANPVGTITIHSGDTNFHYVTVMSPAIGNAPRQFVLRVTSTNNVSAAFTVNESIGYSHIFQFLFQGDITLAADATGGTNAIIQALFLDDAPVTYGPASATNGVSNLNSADLLPALTGAVFLSNGVFQFSFSNNSYLSSNPAASFSILSSTNLALPLSNWTVVGAPSNIAPGQFQFISPPATNDPQRFYRLRSP